MDGSKVRGDLERYAKYIQEKADAYWARFRSFGLPISEMRVLDLGAGPGEFSRRFEESGARSVAWYDISRHYGRMFRSVIRERGLRRAFQVVGQMERLPFATGSFDLVFCRASLHYARHQRRALAEARRVLCQKGWLYLEFDSFRRISRDYPLLTWKRVAHYILGLFASVSGMHLRIPAFQISWMTRLRLRRVGLVPLKCREDGDLVAILAFRDRWL